METWIRDYIRDHHPSEFSAIRQFLFSAVLGASRQLHVALFAFTEYWATGKVMTGTYDTAC